MKICLILQGKVFPWPKDIHSKIVQISFQKIGLSTEGKILEEVRRPGFAPVEEQLIAKQIRVVSSHLLTYQICQLLPKPSLNFLEKRCFDVIRWQPMVCEISNKKKSCGQVWSIYFTNTMPPNSRMENNLNIVL